MKHFKEQDVGVPWDFDNQYDEDRVSVTFISPEAEELNSEESLVSFVARVVCTITTEGLYDLSDLSGKVSALLLEDIITDEGACITPVNRKIEVKLFDFSHGHKQSLMQQQYASRLRG